MKKYILTLLLFTAIICGCGTQNSNDYLEATTKQLDSLNDMLKQTTAISIENDKTMVLRLKETYVVAWWTGAQAASKHPHTLEVAFLADSLRFCNMVDNIFHNTKQ